MRLPPPETRTTPAVVSVIAPMAGERCDRCGARALVMTLHVAGPLTWCGHHFAAHRVALVAVAGVVVAHDLRDQLIPPQRAAA